MKNFSEFNKLQEELDSNDLDILQQHGFKIIDQEFSGPYELYLVYNKEFDVYQLGFQTKSTKFTNPKDQNKKFDMFKNITSIPNTLTLTKKIKSWVALYHKIYIGSENQKKNDKYMRILSGLGFKVKPVEFLGQTRYVITK